MFLATQQVPISVRTIETTPFITVVGSYHPKLSKVRAKCSSSATAPSPTTIPRSNETAFLPPLNSTECQRVLESIDRAIIPLPFATNMYRLVS